MSQEEDQASPIIDRLQRAMGDFTSKQQENISDPLEELLQNFDEINNKSQLLKKELETLIQERSLNGLKVHLKPSRLDIDEWHSTSTVRESLIITFEKIIPSVLTNSEINEDKIVWEKDFYRFKEGKRPNTGDMPLVQEMLTDYQLTAADVLEEVTKKIKELTGKQEAKAIVG